MMMLPAGRLVAFCLFQMIMGSPPECYEENLMHEPTERGIRHLVFKEIREKMPNNAPSYDCELEDAANFKFESFRNVHGHDDDEEYEDDDDGDDDVLDITPTASMKFIEK
ncbi:hypothetical protein Y032_0012g1807 [Ancylostoma ceylanicum]|uniref:Uncharacterized protein n=1 Tax=Ancylostoma ceylanicum TaxID=53326 RepID=A0A016VCA2_9BILA|nr:hypothetical protein Y032_0012g1807 [Ancylostoma ceylanicum]